MGTCVPVQAEMSAQNGPPPQVLGVRWMPEGDELMTVGPSHFKVRQAGNEFRAAATVPPSTPSKEAHRVPVEREPPHPWRHTSVSC